MKGFLLLAFVILTEGKPGFVPPGKPFQGQVVNDVEVQPADTGKDVHAKLDLLADMLSQINSRLDSFEEMVANGEELQSDLDGILSQLGVLEAGLQSLVFSDFIELYTVSSVLDSLSGALEDGDALKRLIIHLTSQTLANEGIDVDIESLLSGEKREETPPAPQTAEQAVEEIRSRLQESEQLITTLSNNKQIMIFLMTSMNQALATYVEVTSAGQNFADYVENVISLSGNLSTPSTTPPTTTTTTTSTPTTPPPTSEPATTPFEGRRRLSDLDLDLLRNVAIKEKAKRILQLVEKDLVHK